jgi:hypothetical protein
MSQQFAPPSTPHGVPVDITTAKKVMANAESHVATDTMPVQASGRA